MWALTRRLSVVFFLFSGPSSLAGHPARPLGETGGPNAGVKPFVVRYLKALRGAESLRATQTFRLHGSAAWQRIHALVAHTPPASRRRELALLRYCAGQRLTRVEPLVSADRERQIAVHLSAGAGHPGCAGKLGLTWQHGHWHIVTEHWQRVQTSRPASK